MEGLDGHWEEGEGVHLRRALICAVLIPLFTLGGTTVASADEGGGIHSRGNEVFAGAWKKRQQTDNSAPSRGYGSSSRQRTAAERQKDYRQSVVKAIAANADAQAAVQRCLASLSTTPCTFAAMKVPPNAPGGGRVVGGVLVPPALSPQQAAYVASARIKLAAPKPMIGPSPDINKWKMAAVGYPLWLWADGTLDPAPVTDSVYDISVGLDAHLVEVVFDMGDGHKVRCSDVSRKWTAAVAAGAESPSCGYRYPKPSLPAGSYTVTANAVWAIDWDVNGTTGTIPSYQSASTTVPVGELQVLVR